MNNRQQAREEALFVLLMEQVARQQDLQARQLGRALEEDPESALSPALQQRCMQTLRRGFRRRDRQAAGRTTRRVLSRVAVAVLAAVLCLTAAFAVSRNPCPNLIVSCPFPRRSAAVDAGRIKAS